jgi:hypothetical protein
MATLHGIYTSDFSVHNVNVVAYNYKKDEKILFQIELKNKL